MISTLRNARGILIACAMAIGLSGCGPGMAVISAGQTVAAVGERVTIESTKALIYAELAYQGVAESALVATRAGLIRGETAARLQTYNRLALEALRKGKAATNAVARAREVAALFKQVDAIRSLTRP